MFSILLVFGFSLSAFAYNKVSFEFGPEASKALVKVLADADNLPEVSKVGYKSSDKIHDASCVTRVLRPMRIPGGVDPDKKDGGNEIACGYHQEPDLVAKGLYLSLANSPVAFWGNNLHFRSFSIKDDLAERLLVALKSNWAFQLDAETIPGAGERSGQYGHALDSFSTGDEMESFAIYNDEKVNPLVECTTFSRFGKRGSMLCAFIYFGKN